jgi:hypothetical protein
MGARAGRLALRRQQDCDCSPSSPTPVRTSTRPPRSPPSIPAPGRSPGGPNRRRQGRPELPVCRRDQVLEIEEDVVFYV